MKKMLIILVLTSCSSGIMVRTDFDKSVEIHRRTTYDWLNKKDIESRNNPLFYNELNDKRIKTAVNAAMITRGYCIDTEKPEFLVHYHITIEDKSQLVEIEPFGYSYNPFWRNSRMDVRRYKEGTLILDFMDPQNCELIWRGWAVSILDDEKLITEDLVNAAVSKILGRFPMSSEKEVKNH